VDQVEKYRTSVHGTLNAKGDAKVAECASCHGSHEIRSAGDTKSSVYAVNLPSTCAKCHSDGERMKPYGIPSDQFAKFSRSVHGVALLERHDVGAPACNDCHGNHGAAPPGVESVSKVCGTCHALNADLFSASPHKKAFDVRKLPECETCHGNHEIVATTDKLLGVTTGAVCSRCHSEKENQKGYLVARTMRAMIDSLDMGMAVADSLMHEAEQKGMEVTESKFKLRDARQSRLQSRTMVHSFSEAKFREVVSQGLGVVATVRSEGTEAIEEFYFRRWGLGIATVIISLVGVSLYVLIRRIERRQKTAKL
jgi:predicted CXXCH cytochrome family protein